MGESGEKIAHQAGISLINLDSEKRRTVKIQNGTATIYEMKNGTYSLEYNTVFGQKIDTFLSSETLKKSSMVRKVVEKVVQIWRESPVSK